MGNMNLHLHSTTSGLFTERVDMMVIAEFSEILRMLFDICMKKI